jgi:serine/threonine protein phosphatase 1
MTLYAIGDIHGQLEQLRAAHERVFRDGGRDALIVHVGDLIDRGPDSRGVVAHLLRGQAEGRRWIVVRGNHDRFLPALAARPDWIDPGLSSARHWLDHPGLGAAETLASYGINPSGPHHEVAEEVRRLVPADHLRFLAGLPTWFLHPLALVVHAGLRPGIDLQRQAEDDLVWIRGPFLDHTGSFGPLVVHGHTALEGVRHHGNRVNIDGGAGHGRPLCAVAIKAGGVHLLTDAGRVPVTPGGGLVSM